MAFTMDDVAKLAGVSPSTVSRVLSKNPHISEDTVNKVMGAVKQLNYHRNIHARRLAIGKSDLFGLVISEITNPFFSEIIRGFQAAAWARGFDVLLLNTEYSEKQTELIAQKLIENDVRGVAIVTSSIDAKVISALTKKEIGVVLCNGSGARRLVSNISIDYERGLIQAIAHVASLGHRRAAVIAGPPTSRVASKIKQVLTDGLRQRGLKPYPVTHSNYDLDASFRAVQVILSAKTVPTVIFCGSDLLAMGAMMALEEVGIDVPRDISVIGIDNILFSFLARPPLTTIHVPREQLGAICFEALSKMLMSKRNKGAEYVLETDLVIRKSTAPVRESSLRGRLASSGS